jgi:hypothetical protein
MMDFYIEKVTNKTLKINTEGTKKMRKRKKEYRRGGRFRNWEGGKGGFLLIFGGMESQSAEAHPDERNSH